MIKDDIDFSEVLQEVRVKYALPSKVVLQNFKDGAMHETKEELRDS